MEFRLPSVLKLRSPHSFPLKTAPFRVLPAAESEFGRGGDLRLTPRTTPDFYRAKPRLLQEFFASGQSEIHPMSGNRLSEASSDSTAHSRLQCPSGPARERFDHPRAAP